MSHDVILPDPDLHDIESALSKLIVAPSRIDRDHVMFEAGRASVVARRSTPKLWPAISACLTVVVIYQSMLLSPQDSSTVIDSVITVREPIVPQTKTSVPMIGIMPLSLALGATEHSRQVEQVIRYGLDGLPSTPRSSWTSSDPASTSVGRLLQEELRRINDPGDVL